MPFLTTFSPWSLLFPLPHPPSPVYHDTVLPDHCLRLRHFFWRLVGVFCHSGSLFFFLKVRNAAGFMTPDLYFFVGDVFQGASACPFPAQMTLEVRPPFTLPSPCPAMSFMLFFVL